MSAKGVPRSKKFGAEVFRGQEDGEMRSKKVISRAVVKKADRFHACTNLQVML